MVVDVKEDTDTKEIPPCIILKSIDSRMRRQIGEELDAQGKNRPVGKEETP